MKGIEQYQEHADRLAKVHREEGEQAFSKQVGEDWITGRGLFMFANQSGESQDMPRRQLVGCLTMIRYDNHVAADGPDGPLTAAIKADERIPKRNEGVTLENLPVFVEWQEQLHRELDRSL